MSWKTISLASAKAALLRHWRWWVLFAAIFVVVYLLFGKADSWQPGWLLRASIFSLAVIVSVAALCFIPLWQVARARACVVAAPSPPPNPQPKDGHDIEQQWFAQENAARQTVATAIGGAVVLAGLYFTFHTFKLSTEGQITDRYAKAIDHLSANSSAALLSHLGGIFELERIARDSERDREPIVDILSSYIRQTPPGKECAEKQKDGRQDVQAIVMVLNRRERSAQILNLSNACLCGLDMHGIDLTNANLEGSDLGWTILTDAILKGADVKNAKFNASTGLAQSQIDESSGNVGTGLPVGIKRPASWQ